MAPNSICICQLNHIDLIINKEVKLCHPRYWNEDHITYTWLRKLILDWPSIYLTSHPSTSVHWDAYKMDGNLEQENGDVAFLIDITFDNGNNLLGVGFLEAKRIYNTGQFDALKWAQLRLLSSNSSNHQLLLYDYEPIETQFPISTCLPCSHCPFCKEYVQYCGKPSEVSAAIVMPTLHAIAYEDKSRNLESIGHRLSEQIVLRYFRGLDLEFDADLVNRVLAGVTGGAKFLAVATIQVGDGTNPTGTDGAQDRKPIKPDEASGYISLLDLDIPRN